MRYLCRTISAGIGRFRLDKLLGCKNSKIHVPSCLQNGYSKLLDRNSGLSDGCSELKLQHAGSCTKTPAKTGFCMSQLPGEFFRHFKRFLTLEDVRNPGLIPGACVLHAFVLVFSSHVQPHKGCHVTKYRSSPLYRSSPPSYLPILPHATFRFSGSERGGGTQSYNPDPFRT